MTTENDPEAFAETLPPAGRERSLRILEQLTGEARPGRRRVEWTLVSAPEDGAAVDAALDPTWHYCLPACFLESLDIADTPRKRDGRTVSVVTQGGNFCFKAGAILYDAPEAYALGWADALRQVGSVLQVTAAAPALENDDGTRDPGQVTFEVLRPAAAGARLEVEDTRQLSQDAFVRLLVTGE